MPGSVSRIDAARRFFANASSLGPPNWLIRRSWSWLVRKVLYGAPASPDGYDSLRCARCAAIGAGSPLFTEPTIVSASWNSNAESIPPGTYCLTSSVGPHTSPTLQQSGSTERM